MATFKNWDYFNKHVQSGLTEGQFINFGGCVLAAGPPYLTSMGSADGSVDSDSVFLIGKIGNWSVGNNLMVVPIPETGSYRRYLVTGPADGQLQLSRTLYHGPSLLRALYAYYSAPVESGGSIPIESLVSDTSSNIRRNPKNRITDAPGYENFWPNLASEVFTQPVGILLFIQDSNRESYGACYFEQTQVVNHGFGGGPGSVVVAEQMSAMFGRCRPVKLPNAVPLMSRAEDAGTITVAGSENTTGGPTRIPQATGTNV